MLTLLSLVTCVCVHWGLNPTIGSRALLFFFPSIIHLSLLSRFHLIHYWRRNATRVWIKRPIFFCLLTTRDDRTKKKRRHRSILGPTPWRKKLSIRLFIFDSSSRWFFFILSLLLFYSVDFFFYLGPSIEMAVYTLERERANKRLLYYWFSLHLGHFW